MLAAARAVDRSLAGAGAATAFHVFGHTHVANDVRLGAGHPAPRYLNAGTWSTMRRGVPEPPSRRLRMVEIEFGGGRPSTARLCRWDATARAAEVA